jgi:hypothetical protein
LPDHAVYQRPNLPSADCCEFVIVQRTGNVMVVVVILASLFFFGPT